ncbi:MAG: alpha/beta fold hydrolase [Rhodoferax sp.]
MKIIANGLQFEVEDSACINPQDADLHARPVVVLVMGLGMQLIAWPQALVDELVDAGFRVLRFDNRDAGLSTHLHHLKPPHLGWTALKHRLGFRIQPPYALADMAQDVLALMDALDIKRAHLVGASMGGMIAQRVALAAPQRVQSLASLMSSSGARKLPPPQPQVLRLMMRRPAGATLEAQVEHTVRIFQAIGSPAYPTPEDELRTRVRAALERAHNPAGVARQMVAVVADHQRAESLARVRCPTLVVHGQDDPLVPLACGEDTAQRIPGAQLVRIPGMGHDLPPAVVDQVLAALVPHLQAAQRQASPWNNSTL